MVAFANSTRAYLFLSGATANFPIRFCLYIQHTQSDRRIGYFDRSVLDTVFQAPIYRIANYGIDRWSLRVVILADFTKDTSVTVPSALGLSPHPIPISLPDER